MKFFRPKEFFSPESLVDALQLLEGYRRDARVIAGGTGIYELAVRNYIPEVKYLVSVMNLDLSYVKEEEGFLHIGATTRLQQLLEDKLINTAGVGAITDALRSIRPLQIRNVATVGGEVCISVPNVDLPTALMACSAQVVIASVKGERVVALDDFYNDIFWPKLKSNEIVTEIRFKKQKDMVSAFLKLGRTAADFNLVNVATSLRVDNNLITDIKLVVGGIGRSPLRFKDLEEALINKRPERELIENVAVKAFHDYEILPSVHGSAEYKRLILPVLIRNCVLKAYNRALGTNESEVPNRI